MTCQGSRRALLLVWLGIAALAMNALAGVAHQRMATGGGKFALEICTPQGIVRLDPATLAVADSPQPVSDYASKARCCDLCGASVVAAIASLPDRLPFAVAFASIDARAPPRDPAFSSAHPALTPLVPRGPPVRS